MLSGSSSKSSPRFLLGSLTKCPSPPGPSQDHDSHKGSQPSSMSESSSPFQILTKFLPGSRPSTQTIIPHQSQSFGLATQSLHIVSYLIWMYLGPILFPLPNPTTRPFEVCPSTCSTWIWIIWYLHRENFLHQNICYFFPLFLATLSGNSIPPLPVFFS